MGMFDYVEFSAPCPECGTINTNNWQSKSGECAMKRIKPGSCSEWHTTCDGCGIWIQYRQPIRIVTEASGPYQVTTHRCPVHFDGAKEDDYFQEGPLKSMSVEEAIKVRPGFSAAKIKTQAAIATGRQPMTIWMAAGTKSSFGTTLLPEYTDYTEEGVAGKILAGARREGCRGGISRRLKQLGWEIVCLEVTVIKQSGA